MMAIASLKDGPGTCEALALGWLCVVLYNLSTGCSPSDANATRDREEWRTKAPTALAPAPRGHFSVPKRLGMRC
jgi:hypothetical protein